MPTSTESLAAVRDKARADALAGFLKTKERTRPGEVRPLSDPGILDVEVVPTGAVSLDAALGCGGFPLGRVIELYGPEMSGKTSLALSVAANAQRTRPGAIGFIDAEQALNLKHVRAMGVDPARLVLFQPGYGEEAIDMVEDMIKSGAFEMIIVDSVAALTPKAEIEGTIEDGAPMASHAKLMSTFMRRVVGLLNEHNVMLVLINQLREKPGNAYGNPEYVTGGRAIKFYASVRIEVRANAVSKRITRGDHVVGQTTTAKIAKNKVGPPHRTAEYDLYFDQGIDTVGSLLGAAVQLGVVAVSGANYTHVATGERFTSRGKEAAKAHLRENPEFAATIEREIYAALHASGEVDPLAHAGSGDASGDDSADGSVDGPIDGDGEAATD